MASLRDVVVVGSGPNGLTAAIELARRGYSAEVFEAGDGIGYTRLTWREEASGPWTDSVKACTRTPARPRERAAPREPWWKGLRSRRNKRAGTAVSSDPMGRHTSRFRPARAFGAPIGLPESVRAAHCRDILIDPGSRSPKRNHSGNTIAPPG
ncbi:NAD(P)-binding protein [Streptomyces alkaliphilus]|uniref:NAD(P)-binding protein n=1 Tax=Streptomyces alkaliphilus TaxID=1472722 RepID=A0A7W3Y388_9ACTN|nr:NAD(P)-binding protein [Streptomyces alkaliphilus]